LELGIGHWALGIGHGALGIGDQYGSVKPTDVINRRQDKGLIIIVETAIYRVFVI
jgi:hypothetical protein